MDDGLSPEGERCVKAELDRNQARMESAAVKLRLARAEAELAEAHMALASAIVSK